MRQPRKSCTVGSQVTALTVTVENRAKGVSRVKPEPEPLDAPYLLLGLGLEACAKAVPISDFLPADTSV